MILTLFAFRLVPTHSLDSINFTLGGDGSVLIVEPLARRNLILFTVSKPSFFVWFRSLPLHIILHFKFAALPLQTGAGLSAKNEAQQIYVCVSCSKVWDFIAWILFSIEVERARNQGCVTLWALGFSINVSRDRRLQLNCYAVCDAQTQRWQWRLAVIQSMPRSRCSFLRLNLLSQTSRYVPAWIY